MLFRLLFPPCSHVFQYTGLDHLYLYFFFFLLLTYLHNQRLIYCTPSVSYYKFKVFSLSSHVFYFYITITTIITIMIIISQIKMVDNLL